MFFVIGIKFQEIISVSRFCWKIMFISGSETNKAIKNSLLKKRKMDAFIPGYLRKRKSVIHGVPDDIPLKEIQEIAETENIKVVNMFRLKRRNKVTKKWEDSNSVSVELRGNVLPEYGKVKMWKVRILVLPYISLGRICFKCGRIGHIVKTCENKERCLTCGKSHLTDLKKTSVLLEKSA